MWAIASPNSSLFYTGWQNVPKSEEVDYGITGSNFPINGAGVDDVFDNALASGHDYATVSVQVGTVQPYSYNPHVSDPATYSKSFTVKLRAPQNWVPEFDLAFLLSQTYGGKCYTNVSDVQYGVSNVAFPGGATLGPGSSVALNGASTQIGSLPFENVISPVTRSGVNEVTATIVDSRGRSTTKTATFVSEYPPSPTIDGMTVSRCLADGTPDDDGEFVRVGFAVSGRESPPVALDYIHVDVLDAGGGVFGFDDVQGLAPLLSLSSHRVIAGVGNGETASNLVLSPNEQYSVTLTVKGLVNDELRNGTVVRRCLSSKTVILPRAFRLMDCLAGGRGIAFGAPATDEGFACAMAAAFTGGVTSDPPIPNDSLDAAPRSHTHDYAASGHRHAAGDITSGTLPVARGGTGQTSLQATRNAMGLGNTTGALPVANGGTGATSAANARTNLGISNAVTAEGNSGIWHYRKYSNGYAEAWGSATFTPSGMTNDNWRWLSTSHASTQSLPFTFKKVMTADVSYNNPAIFSVIGVANASGTYTSINATKIQYWCISAVAVATSADAYIYVCGTY